MVCLTIISICAQWVLYKCGHLWSCCNGNIKSESITLFIIVCLSAVFCFAREYFANMWP